MNESNDALDTVDARAAALRDRLAARRARRPV